MKDCRYLMPRHYLNWWRLIGLIWVNFKQTYICLKPFWLFTSVWNDTWYDDLFMPQLQQCFNWIDMEVGWWMNNTSHKKNYGCNYLSIVVISYDIESISRIGIRAWICNCIHRFCVVCNYSSMPLMAVKSLLKLWHGWLRLHPTKLR